MIFSHLYEPPEILILWLLHSIVSTFYWQALATSRFTRPVISRKYLANLFSGTIPNPILLVTKNNSFIITVINFL